MRFFLTPPLGSCESLSALTMDGNERHSTFCLDFGFQFVRFSSAADESSTAPNVDKEGGGEETSAIIYLQGLGGWGITSSLWAWVSSGLGVGWGNWEVVLRKHPPLMRPSQPEPVCPVQARRTQRLPLVENTRYSELGAQLANRLNSRKMSVWTTVRPLNQFSITHQRQQLTRGELESYIIT